MNLREQLAFHLYRQFSTFYKYRNQISSFVNAKFDFGQQNAYDVIVRGFLYFVIQ